MQIKVAASLYNLYHHLIQIRPKSLVSIIQSLGGDRRIQMVGRWSLVVGWAVRLDSDRSPQIN
jgi:hypothetical protein